MAEKELDEGTRMLLDVATLEQRLAGLTPEHRIAALLAMPDEMFQRLPDDALARLEACFVEACDALGQRQRRPDVPIPPELPVEHVDAYIAQVRRLVAEGGDAARIAREYSSTVRQLREAGMDPFDPSLDERVDVPLRDIVHWLETGEGDPCAR